MSETNELPKLTPRQIANRRKWIAALRSGKYRQGRNYLFTAQGRFCCLGVACEIGAIEAIPEWRDEQTLADMPFEDDLGLADEDGRLTDDDIEALSALNDSGTWRFSAIADLIELDTEMRS